MIGSPAPDALGNIRTRNDGSQTAAIAYDAVKNRVASATVNGAGRNFTYDPGSSPGQAARGNVANNGQTGFIYDFANQPTALTGAGAAAYSYDGNLKRVKEVRAGKTVYTVYSRVTGGLVYRDEATDNETTDYASAGGAAIRLIRTGTGPAAADYSHFDAQGSVIADTRTLGQVLWRESYEPFGRTRVNAAANDNDTGYTGHLKDKDSGLQYMQARYYDPLIGRFYSTDPVGYQDQLNLYAYVANDPVNAVDPNGEDTVVIVEAYPLGEYPNGQQYGHAYLYYYDEETGDTSAARISRAGPSGDVDASAAVSGGYSGGQVTAVDTLADDSIDVGQPGTVEVTRSVVPESVEEVQATLEGFNDSVNASGSPYSARNNNSNTYAGDAYEAVTGSDPNNNTDLDLPDFEDDLE